MDRLALFAAHNMLRALRQMQEEGDPDLPERVHASLSVLDASKFLDCPQEVRDEMASIRQRIATLLPKAQPKAQLLVTTYDDVD